MTHERRPPRRSAGITVAWVLLLALASPGAAQLLPSDGRAESGRGFFQAGYMTLDLDELNASLGAAGYPSFGGGFPTLGGAGYGARGRFLLGGEGHGLVESGRTTADGSHRLGVSGGYGLLRIGYVAFAREGLDVFPAIGVGGGGMSVKIVERSSPTFDDVLTVPERSATLTTGMFLLDFSLAANYRIPLRAPEDEEAGGALVGVQAGYAFAPGSPTWELDGLNHVAGGPALEIEGLYVRVSLGGWGRRDGEE